MLFLQTYTPTGFEKYSAKRKIGEFSVEYSIWDTSGMYGIYYYMVVSIINESFLLFIFFLFNEDVKSIALNEFC